MSESKEIPHHIDDPKQFLLWTVDDALPFITFMFIGYMTGYIIASGIIGVSVSYFYRRFREVKPEGILLHVCYWFGIVRKKSHVFPDPYIKQYLP